jgi:hypothetical protein
MNRAIVVGAYEFLGFHLTMQLLDLGLEVAGIIPGSREDDRYTAEKRLLVGRNANFKEYSAEDWKDKGSVGEPHFIFVSLYDYYFREEPELPSWEGLFGHFKGAIEETGSKPVILMPVQFYKGSAEGSRCQSGALKIYLPTLFGRWQPSAFAFQQVIEGLDNKDNTRLEHKGDAIYAAEAAAGIIEAAETKAGTLLFSSGEEGRWGKCAKHLGMKEPANCSSVIFPEAEKKIIKEQTPYHTVLDKQLEYVKRGHDPFSRPSGPVSPKDF